MNQQTPVLRKIIRWKAVREATCLSRSTVNKLEAANDFPRRIQLGPRAAAWYEEEIAAWLESRRRKVE